MTVHTYIRTYIHTCTCVMIVCVIITQIHSLLFILYHMIIVVNVLCTCATYFGKEETSCLKWNLSPSTLLTRVVTIGGLAKITDLLVDQI